MPRRPLLREDWARHKRACQTAVAAQARQATSTRERTRARKGGGEFDKETCVICIGPVVAPVELPCLLRRVPDFAARAWGGAGLPPMPSEVAAGHGRAVRPGGADLLEDLWHEDTPADLHEEGKGSPSR